MVPVSPRPPASRHPRNSAAPAQASGPARAAGLALAACLAFPAGGTAQVRTYALDPVHTRVVFAVDHAGFSRAMGAVSGTTGTLRFDPGDWAGAQVEAWVPLERLDLGDAEWNRATLAPRLLDVLRHPYAVFTSGHIEPIGPDRARIHGTLSLRGVSRPVVLDAVFNAARRHPLPPFRRTVGFSGVAMLSRSDFGISAWPGVIGDDVELRIEVEAVHAPDAEFTATEQEP